MTKHKAVDLNQLDYERADLLLGVQQKAVPNGSALSALASEAMAELREINEKAQENITKRGEAEAKEAQEQAEEQAKAAKKLEGEKQPDPGPKASNPTEMQVGDSQPHNPAATTQPPPKGPPTPAMGGAPAPKKG